MSKLNIPQLKLIDHPLLKHNLAVLRDKSTRPSKFRQVMLEVGRLLAYEATRDLKIRAFDVETPMEKTRSDQISEPITIVTIMRAGNIMADGLLEMLPFSSVGHIGIYRDKFIKNTVEYYFRLPPQVAGSRILLTDPLVATGDTALASIDRLKEYEVGPIHLICLLISPQALERLRDEHPDVNVHALCVERELNEDGYLLPGLGDAGDRIYGTLDSEGRM